MYFNVSEFSNVRIINCQNVLSFLPIRIRDHPVVSDCVSGVSPTVVVLCIGNLACI